MLTESLSIEIDGAEATDVYDDLTVLEVELDEELQGMFRMRLPLASQPDGSWAFLDDERFRAWVPVTIAAGLGGAPQELIAGYITHVRPTFEPDPTHCFLDVWGLDASVLMDRQDRLQDWPSKSDSDIASEIFGRYGMSAEVENTEVVHDEAVSTIIQRETDWQFLKRLSLRNGFECFVEGTTGFFRLPRTDAEPQALLAVHFGEETNVNRFSIQVNALAPANVSMFQLDRSNKEVLAIAVDASELGALGATGAAQLGGAGVPPGSLVVARAVTTGTAEMAGLCRGLFQQGDWFVTGAGEVAANQSGVVLRPRVPVTIKGIGETYSGVYLVSHVTHSFSGEGYTQAFEVKRNGLLPTGAERFSSDGAGLLGGLA